MKAKSLETGSKPREMVGEAVLNRLLALFAGNQFKIGERLASEPTLAVQMGVSRITLREALKVLAAMGTIEIRRGRGTFLISRPPVSLTRPVSAFLTLEGVSVLELLDARRAIETYTIERAVSLRTDQQLTNLSRIVKELQDFGAPPERYIDLDAEFHIAIAESARNGVMLAVVKMIRQRLRQELLEVVKVAWAQKRDGRKARESSNEQHKKIVDAIARRDVKRAVKVMSKHLEALEREVGSTRRDAPETPKLKASALWTEIS